MMKRCWSVALLSLSAACATTVQARVEIAVRSLPSEPVAQGPLDEASMHAALDAHGRWRQTVSLGAVWVPEVREAFTPYVTHGQWLYTEQGPYWASSLSWGATTFHYGRWVPFEGAWAWAPSSQWAPAWVDWRSGNGYYGWAPRAPRGATWNSAFHFVAAARLFDGACERHVARGREAEVAFANSGPLYQSWIGDAQTLSDGRSLVPWSIPRISIARAIIIEREGAAAPTGATSTDPSGAMADNGARDEDESESVNDANVRWGTVTIREESQAEVSTRYAPAVGGGMSSMSGSTSVQSAPSFARSERATSPSLPSVMGSASPSAARTLWSDEDRARATPAFYGRFGGGSSAGGFAIAQPASTGPTPTYAGTNPVARAVPAAPTTSSGRVAVSVAAPRATTTAAVAIPAATGATAISPRSSVGATHSAVTARVR